MKDTRAEAGAGTRRLLVRLEVVSDCPRLNPNSSPDRQLHVAVPRRRQCDALCDMGNGRAGGQSLPCVGRDPRAARPRSSPTRTCGKTVMLAPEQYPWRHSEVE